MNIDIPEGWATCSLGDIADVALGKMLDKAKSVKGELLPYLRNANVRWNGFDLSDVLTMRFEAHELDRYAVCDGDVFVCEGGEPGRAAVWRGQRQGLKYQKALLRVRPFGGIRPEWVVGCFQRAALAGELETYFTGSTIKHLPREAAVRLALPIAPVEEQRRIMGRVDALLDQVNRARTRLDRVRLIIRRFRQAVLTAAYSGELTSDFRDGQIRRTQSRVPTLLESRRRLWEERQRMRIGLRRPYRDPASPQSPDDMEVPESWEWVTVSHLAFLDVGFSFKSSDFAETGIRLLRGENIAPGSLRWSDTKFWPAESIQGFEHLLVEPGEIILGMDRPIVSAGLKIARVTLADVPALLVQRVMRFKMVEGSDTEYLYYWLAGKRFMDFLVHDGMTGSDLPHITGIGVAQYPVPLPPAAEQAEIVSRIRALMKLADAVEKRVQLAAARTGRMTQAILSKAFAGELVPTEAELARAEGRSYETAQELLSRIQSSTGTSDDRHGVSISRGPRSGKRRTRASLRASIS